MKLKQKLTFIVNNKSYLNFFIGSLISSVGTGMHFIALTWIILSLTGKPSSIGFLMILTVIPNILLNPVLGVFIDRFDRRLVCVVADIFCGGVILTIPFFYYTDNLTTWVLYTVAFLASLGEKVYVPGRDGLLREIVPKKKLLTVNSMAIGIIQTGMLVGAGFSGFLIAMIGSINVILINGLSYLIAAIFTFFVRKRIKKASMSESRGLNSVAGEFKEGATYLIKKPLILKLGIVQAILFTTLYTTNVLLPSFAKFSLNVGEEGYGIIDASWALGSLIGAMVLFSLIKSEWESFFLKFGLIVIAGTVTFFSLSQGLIQATIGYLFMGIAFVITRIIFDTKIQMEVDTEFQGRVKSVLIMVVSFVALGIYTLVGLLADVISIRSLYFMLVALLIGGSILSIYFNITSSYQKKVYSVKKQAKA